MNRRNFIKVFGAGTAVGAGVYWLSRGPAYGAPVPLNGEKSAQPAQRVPRADDVFVQRREFTVRAQSAFRPATMETPSAPRAEDLLFATHANGSASLVVFGGARLLTQPNQINDDAVILPDRQAVLSASEAILFDADSARRLDRKDAKGMSLFVRRQDERWGMLRVLSVSAQSLTFDYIELPR